MPPDYDLMPPGPDTEFETLVRAHAGLVSRIAATYERRPALIEELAQDIFLAVFQALQTYRGEASMRTFIARVAHNVCIDHVRRAVRRPPETDVSLAAGIPDSRADPADEIDLAQQRERLLSAVRHLDLPLRQVISLHLEGFSNLEIANALSLTPGNVGVRLHRARTVLEKQMTGTPPEKAVP